MTEEMKVIWCEADPIEHEPDVIYVRFMTAEEAANSSVLN